MASPAAAWLANDEDGDGTVSGAEMIDAYDKDHDGKLDAAELEDISRAYAGQIDYSNTLLNQIADMEQGQLKIQQEMQDKTANFRMTVKACDDKRKECNDLREKMKGLQDRAASLAQSEQESRSSLSVHQRQIDGLNHIRDKLSEENSTLKEEIDRLRAEANEHLTELSGTRTERNRLEAEHAQRVQSLNTRHEQVVRERAALKTRQAQLQPEVQNLRRQYQEQHDALQQAQQELSHASARAQTGERNVTELQETLRVTQASEMRMSQALEEERQRTKALQEDHAKLTEAKSQGDHELQMLHRSRVEMERHITTITTEKTTLETQMDQHLNEHGSHMEGHAHDRAGWESKHEELKQDLDSLATETRRRMRQHEEEKGGLLKGHQERQRLDHERYSKLQAEYRHLHELLQTTQTECSQQASGFEEERANHDKRLVALQERLNKSESALQELQKRTTHEKAELAADHSSLQQHTLARTTQYVKMLSLTQQAVQQLGGDGTQVRDEQQAALGEVRTALHSLAQLRQAMQNPVTEWHAEVKRAFLSLIEKINALTRQSEDAKDALITAELQFQEERSKTLMLQEDKSRLSTTIAELQKKIEDSSKHYEEQLRSSRAETRAATELKDMIEHNLRTTQNDLEEMQRLMRTLQEDNQKLNVDLGETQARQAEKVTMLEETLHDLQSRNRLLESESATSGTEKDALRRSLQEHAETIRRLREDVKRLEDAEREAHAQHKAEMGKNRREIASMGDTVRSLRAQAEKTKSVLDVVQKRRQQLQDENVELKQIMDDLYKQGSANSTPHYGNGAPPAGPQGGNYMGGGLASSPGGGPGGGLGDLKSHLSRQLAADDGSRN